MRKKLVNIFTHIDDKGDKYKIHPLNIVITASGIRKQYFDAFDGLHTVRFSAPVKIANEHSIGCQAVYHCNKQPF